MGKRFLFSQLRLLSLRKTSHLSKVRSSSIAQHKSHHQPKVATCRNYLFKLNSSSAYQPHFCAKQILLSYLCSFIGIAALAYLSTHSNYPLIAAPFGATAVLVSTLPDSPLAQPRNIIGGNCLGAIVSLIVLHLFGSAPWVMALSVATAINLMQLTKTLHPPGGAVALVGVMSHADWNFLLTPVLVGSIVMVICTLLFNNLVQHKSYPIYWL